MSKDFKRTSAHIKIKLGKNNKRKQKWRRAVGIHNKIREKRKGKIRNVEVGFRTNAKDRFKINGKIPVFVKNINDAMKLEKKSVVIIASLGRRKKIEIEKIVKEKECVVANRRKE